MSGERKPLTNIEWEMLLDEEKRVRPFRIQAIVSESKVYRARYDSLIEEGFTEDQALQIILQRGLN